MQIRRRYLEPNPVGRRLVVFYEAMGPGWARSLDQHPALKPLIRFLVEPVAQACRLLVSEQEAR